ncbi:MAG: esterase [Tidjanibacter sp.]|nr:esterase [Tidjanibacter sp.]
MKKFFVTLSACLFAAVAVNAQELANWNWAGQQAKTEVTADGVIFRLSAPYATVVKVNPSWTQAVEMTKGEKGVWEAKVALPAPEIYTYSFTVDGVNMSDASNLDLQRDGTRYMSMLIIPGERSAHYDDVVENHGDLHQVWYDSPTLGIERRVFVYTPHGYTDKENAKKKYPVLYLLHGAGGDEDAWSSMGRTCQIMDHLIANGEAEPMLVVMPNGNATQRAAQTLGLPQAQISREQAGQMSYTNSIVKDIVPYIEANYRVYKDKAHRAVAGLSMGGGHTATVSRDFPGTFDYVGVYSGAVGSIKDREGNLNQDMVNKLKAQQKAGYKLYWIACGNTDFLYQQNLEYMKGLDEIGFTYTWFESEGGHTWDNWRMYLDTFAPMLFK